MTPITWKISEFKKYGYRFKILSNRALTNEEETRTNDWCKENYGNMGSLINEFNNGRWYMAISNIKCNCFLFKEENDMTIFITLYSGLFSV